MRTAPTAFAFVSCLVACGTPRPPAPGTTKMTAKGDTPTGEIVTDQVKEMNSAKYGRPPVKFRPGATTKIEPPKPAKTATGFQVAFASAAQITTPTVYDHK